MHENSWREEMREFPNNDGKFAHKSKKKEDLRIKKNNSNLIT
jgi:hypothetical protein